MYNDFYMPGYIIWIYLISKKYKTFINVVFAD